MLNRIVSNFQADLRAFASGPSPEDPFYKGSMEQIIENATHDLKALQNGGVDGVLMTNEFSGPFFTDTPKPVFGAMCRIFGEIRHLFTVPYGVETTADGEGCVEICAATGRFLYPLPVHRRLGWRYRPATA